MMFDYILIAGVNDTDEQACELAKIARRLSAKINLIPYNTVEGLEWSRPSRARQEKFQSILRKHGVIATLRREKRPRHRRRLRSVTTTDGSNGADGISDIEHVAIGGIARVDGNAARVAGASTGQCE